MDKKQASRAIIEKGVKQVLEEAKVPLHLHLKVVRKLREATDKHKEDMDEYQKLYKKHKKDIEAHEQRDKDHEEQVSAYSTELQRVTDKDWTGAEGVPGKDAQEVDIPALIEQIIPHIVSRIPLPKDGLPGRDGKDAETADEEKIINKFIQRIQKGDVIHINHVKGAGGFIKDGIKYRFEELMHGGGSKSSGGFSIIPVSGTINDSNTSFSSAAQPTLLNINGAFYQSTGGAITWSYSGGTITLSSPVGTGGSIFGV